MMLRHPVATGFIVAFFICALMICVAETSLRLLSYNPPQPFAFVEDTELGHFIRPCFHMRHSAPDGEPYDIFTNIYGLFDLEYRGEQPAILLIGDSFTISAVPFEDKWGRLLERALKRKVVKAGVSAYGTEKEYLLLKRLLPIVKPQLIILGYYINDPIDDYIGIDRYGVINGHLYEKKIVNYDTGQIHRILTKDGFGYLETLARHHSVLFNFFSDSLKSCLSRYFGIHSAIEQFDPSLSPLFDPRIKWTDKCYNNHFANIMKIKELADSCGAYLMVLIIPAKEQVYFEKWQKAYGNKPWYDRELPTRRVAEFLEKNKILHVNLLPVFNEKGGSYYFEQDIHWNKSGDKLVANTVERFLRERGLVP